MACEKKLDVEIVNCSDDSPECDFHRHKDSVELGDEVELQIVHRKIEVRDPVTGEVSYVSRMAEVEVPKE